MPDDHRSKPVAESDLLSFLKDMGCSGMQLKLLRFWGRHPRAKLSLYTIARASDAARIDLRDAMADLVEKGILTVQHNDNGLTTYALTGDQRTQEHIDELASLGRSEAISLEKQMFALPAPQERTARRIG